MLFRSKSFDAALKIRVDIEEQSNVAGSRLQLAALSIEDGNPADAESVARQVRDEYRKEGHPDDELAADVVLLQALFAQQKWKEADQELQNIEPIAAKSQNVPTRLALQIVKTRIQAATGEPDDALRQLATAMRDATNSGLVPSQLEVRLARATIEFQSGNTAPARAALSVLRKDAEEKGFELISRKALTTVTAKPPKP